MLSYKFNEENCPVVLEMIKFNNVLIFCYPHPLKQHGLSCKETWISFYQWDAWSQFGLKLAQWFRWKNIFRSHRCIFNVTIISLHKTSLEQTFYQNSFEPSLIETDSVFLEKIKMWNVYNNATTDDKTQIWWSENLISAFSSGELKREKKRNLKQVI